MPEEARRTRRGPNPDPERGEPSGFRISERTRFELRMAAMFVGTDSLQATIALAVREFLGRMRQVDGFAQAVDAAEEGQRKRAGVARLDPPTEP